MLSLFKVSFHWWSTDHHKTTHRDLWIILCQTDTIMGLLLFNIVEERLAVAVMKGLRVPDTFCESRLGLLPGHEGKAPSLLPCDNKKLMVCSDTASKLFCSCF